MRGSILVKHKLYPLVSGAAQLSEMFLECLLSVQLLKQFCHVGLSGIGNLPDLALAVGGLL